MKISPQFVVSCDHLQRERVSKHIEVTQGVHMPVEVYVGVFYGLAETGFCLERLDFQWWVARERLVSGGAVCQMGKFGQRSRTAGSVVYCAPLGNGTPYAIAPGVQDAETTVSSEGSIIGHPSLYSIIFVFGRTDI